MTAVALALLAAGLGLGFASGLVFGLRLAGPRPATASLETFHAEHRAPPNPMADEAERAALAQAAAAHEAAVDRVLEMPEAQAAGMNRQAASAWLRQARSEAAGRSMGGGLVDWTSAGV